MFVYLLSPRWEPSLSPEPRSPWQSMLIPRSQFFRSPSSRLPTARGPPSAHWSGSHCRCRRRPLSRRRPPTDRRPHGRSSLVCSRPYRQRCEPSRGKQRNQSNNKNYDLRATTKSKHIFLQIAWTNKNTFVETWHTNSEFLVLHKWSIQHASYYAYTPNWWMAILQKKIPHKNIW